jgi:hypothetical protein
MIRPTIILACAAAFIAQAGAADSSHQEQFEHYEGTATCLTCHTKDARDFFHSQHYQMEDFEYGWVEVERWMGIYHEVQPADNALRCLDCHGPDGRLDWAGLGYEADPTAAVFNPSH